MLLVTYTYTIRYTYINEIIDIKRMLNRRFLHSDSDFLHTVFVVN